MTGPVSEKKYTMASLVLIGLGITFYPSDSWAFAPLAIPAVATTLAWAKTAALAVGGALGVTAVASHDGDKSLTSNITRFGGTLAGGVGGAAIGAAAGAAVGSFVPVVGTAVGAVAGGVVGGLGGGALGMRGNGMLGLAPLMGAITAGVTLYLGGGFGMALGLALAAMATTVVAGPLVTGFLDSAKKSQQSVYAQHTPAVSAERPIPDSPDLSHLRGAEVSKEQAQAAMATLLEQHPDLAAEIRELGGREHTPSPERTTGNSLARRT